MLLSQRATALQSSKIRDVAEFGMKLGGAIPLWFGEGAWPTPDHIVEAAVSSLRAGNHKYQPNNGSMRLRSAISKYCNDLVGSSLSPQNITVTPSGMQGIMLTAEVLVTPGDRVVVTEPGWPNIAGAFAAVGADLERIQIRPVDGRWSLDLDELLAALTPATRALVINSPNNPTGWTMSAAEQAAVLEHCRQHGIWIVADDVYSRLYRHGRHAPSFLSIAQEEDLLVSVHSFSKCWSMTGWRLGWITAPAAIEERLGQLTEFNTSCTAGFIQDAGIEALEHGEGDVETVLARINAGYEITARHLRQFERVQFLEPDGAFYAFFKVEGVDNSLEFAKTILKETGVGLAPGIAFGQNGEGHMRLCYAQPEDVLEEAFSRLAKLLG